MTGRESFAAAAPLVPSAAEPKGRVAYYGITCHLEGVVRWTVARRYRQCPGKPVAAGFRSFLLKVASGAVF